MKKGFTLLEILLTIGLIILISSIFLRLLNPLEILKRNRDFQRINDLNALENAINAYLSSHPYADLDGFLNDFKGSDEFFPTIFISVPYDREVFLNATITDSLNKTWYITQNAHSAELKNINGSGWLPIDFTELKYRIISYLPVDPINSINSSFFYSYAFNRKTKEFELNAKLEHKDFNFGGTQDKTSKDGGSDNEVYEAGTNKCLIIGNRIYGDISTTTCKESSPYKITGVVETNTWWQFYRGSNINALAQESTSTYLISGYKENQDNLDFWFARLDATGTILFATTAVSGIYNDVINSMIIDGSNYIFAGYTFSFGTGTPTSSNGVVFKTDSYGDLIWFFVYGEEENDFFQEVKKAPNGNYLVIGIKRLNDKDRGLILEIASNSPLVINSYEFEGGSIMNSGVIIDNDKFLITGGNLLGAPFLAKINLDNFSQIATETLDLPGQIITKIIPSQLSPNLFYLLLNSEGNAFEIREVNINNLSTSSRITFYTSVNNIFANSFLQDKKGDFIITGCETTVPRGRRNLVIFKFSGPDLIWKRAYLYGCGKEVIPSLTSSYLIGGYNEVQNGGWLINVDENGECPGCFVFKPLYMLLANFLKFFP